MKIRLRLFLWVGSLFLICFLLAVYIEAILTKQLLEKTEGNISNQLAELNQQQKDRTEHFLAEIIAERLGEIETLLSSIASFPMTANQFLNPQETWQAAGNLLISNKWIDILQSSLNNEISSSLLVADKVNHPAKIVARASEKDAIVAVMLDDVEWTAVMIPMNFAKNTFVEGQEVANLYLLFSKEQLSLLKNIHFDSAGMGDLVPIITALEQLLHLAAEPLHWLPVMTAPSEPSLEAENEIGKLFLKEIDVFHEHSHLIIMIHTLTKFISSQLFGTSPYSPAFPKGIILYHRDSKSGDGVFTNSVLKKSLFPITIVEGASIARLPYKLAIVDGEGELFLASSLCLSDASKTSDLTIGVSANTIAKLLEDSINLPVICAYGNKLFLNGTKWDEMLSSFPLEEMRDKKDGIVSIRGCDVFFYRIQPIRGLDLHFFVVNLASREFAILDAVKEGAIEVINSVSRQIWIVAIIAIIVVLVLLSRISKRITNPLTKLAKATSALQGGRLSEVDLPKINIGRKDEVQTLYLAFSEMVQSLKDKEKVRAVLNKVVSPTIANEILKSGMKLGGEKKQVCIMFADIRGFTKMTENMEPEHVIVMLNHCMTRVSRAVDDKGGVIDKYVGDAVMALFGIPVFKDQDPLRAVEAAYEIQKILSHWNQERQQQGFPPIYMGIGIDIGEVIAGNMGAEDRQNYTVLGRHVNMAARLCGLASPGQILISEAIAKSPGIKEQYTIREIGKETLKGFSEPMPVYEVIR